VIITTGKIARENPALVKNMFIALQEGWRAYLDNPRPANAVMEKLNGDMDPQTFAAAAEAQKPLIETDETKSHGLGMMTLDRWQTLVKQLLDLKVVDKPVAAGECFAGK
jgi:NitT/TauT family transport system substrate-binding protein